MPPVNRRNRRAEERQLWLDWDRLRDSLMAEGDRFRKPAPIFHGTELADTWEPADPAHQQAARARSKAIRAALHAYLAD